MFSIKQLYYHRLTKLFLLVLFISSCQSTKKAEEEWKHDLKISENGHYLANQDGSPFYWIGDTGWAMFQQLTREEIDQYLDNRKEKGFTLIQAVAYWYPHGAIEALGPLNQHNVYGLRPFVGERNAPETS